MGVCAKNKNKNSSVSNGMLCKLKKVVDDNTWRYQK